ncbi:major facilitator superfamily domain-containing protein [Aspergillus novoparasiticus]|uniref:Major facilitator superfamily domain-containing protein n=1 Tax=Aspergillus novoparasiticus TaxID=986946 RepID=A0A5N6EIG2_9EURO|nr:major facilitator superfamily domain-containing protein [Aspergillus novoparasiticus]
MLQLTWGFTISFGAFREYYFYESAFSGSQVIAVIGVASTPLLCVSSAIVVAASIGAGFSHTPVQLVMTQGVLYGLGSGLFFAPNMSLIDEWFIRQRSLAYGIYFACSSITAAIIPPVMRVLLSNPDRRATTPAAIVQVRGERKENPLSGQFSYAFLRKPLFWLILLSNVLQALSQYLPSIYIPSYATAVIGASSASASALLAIYNIASAICQPFLGLLAGKRGILYPLLLSLAMFFRRGATIASGFVVTAVSSAGEDRGLHEGSYRAGQWLPLILTVGILTGVSCIGALGFLREGKQERSGENRSEQDHGDS